MEKYAGYVRSPHYYETDQMQIIHHSNYIRWFEEARVALLEHLGLPYHVLEESGIIVPVLGVSCQYKEMIHYGETVKIHVNVEKYTGTRLNFTYHITPVSDETKILTHGDSQHCFLQSETGRLVHLKKANPTFHQLFSDYASL